MIENHVKWYNKITYLKLNDNQTKLLNEGLIYQIGRDKMYRPIMILDLKKIIKYKDNKEDLMILS